MASDGSPLLPRSPATALQHRHPGAVPGDATVSAPWPEPVPVVCFAVGELYGLADQYVTRVYRMLCRHAPGPFTLYCYTDRPRRAPQRVRQRDCAGWSELLRPGMHATMIKLGLFNPAYVEFESFLYLDLSLVIRRNLRDLLSHAWSRTQPLVIVDHWHYDGYNSSVMRIRRGPLQVIYQAFIDGASFEQEVPGDQDFVRGVVRAHGLQSQVALFQTHQVVSFKKTRKAGRRDAALARTRIAGATIVKFHGKPKMHEAFTMRYRFHVRFEELLHGNLRPVVPLGALRREWIGAGNAPTA